MTTERGVPIWYLFDADSRVITLAEHNGAPTRIKGRLFQEKLERSGNADELAVKLWLRSRGKAGDDPFDYYIPNARLPKGI